VLVKNQTNSVLGNVSSNQIQNKAAATPQLAADKPQPAQDQKKAALNNKKKWNKMI